MSQSYDHLTVFPGESFDYDEKDDFLGAGAFGSVFRARKKSSGEAVALKVIRTTPQLKARQEDMIKKEVAILQKLAGCRNVIRMLGVCMTPHYAIVMEYIENGDLGELLLYKQEEHPVIKEWDCRIRMGLDIATGMNFLHTQQPSIIHKDLKSANVLVDQNYCCKISDFGLPQTRGISLQTSTMSSSQHGGGTLAYTAPEKFRGDADAITADKKTDVYSFSIVMWHMKELKVPFADEPNWEMIRLKVLAGIRPPISDDECPEGLINLITRCWHPQPEVRTTFSEIIVVLEGILTIIRNGCSPQTPYNTVKRRKIDYGGDIQEVSHEALGMTGDVQPNFEKFASAAAKRKRLSSKPAAAVKAFCDLIPEEKWQRLTDLPGSTIFESNHCVVTAEEKVIVAGDKQLYTSNIKTLCSQWAIHDTLPAADARLTTVFTAGGCCFASFSRTAWHRQQGIALYNMRDDSWLDVCELPSCNDLISYSVVGHGDHAYVVGGKTRWNLDTVLIYDLQNGKQCGSQKLQGTRTRCSAVVVDNTLYVGGGQDRRGGCNVVESMSVSDYSCHSIVPTPNYRCSLSSVSGRLVATGGSFSADDSSYGRTAPSGTKAAYMLDASSGTWVLRPEMNADRLYHGMCTVGDQVVMAVGGYSKGDERYSVKTVEALKVQL